MPPSRASLRALAEGKRVALVSDAGMPLISDPGYRLVRAAWPAGHAVTAAPGASAVPMALALSGLPTDRFFFGGFLPAKAGERRRAIADAAHVPATLVFFEAPHRLAASLADLADLLGDAAGRGRARAHQAVRGGAPCVRSTELAAHYARAARGQGRDRPRDRTAGRGGGAAAETLDAALRHGDGRRLGQGCRGGSRSALWTSSAATSMLAPSSSSARVMS